MNNLVDIPGVGNISTKLTSAQLKLAEIDRMLVSLDNLTVIQQEMNDSHQKLSSLFEEYQKEKSTEKLFEIEEVLNSNLIYQIEKLSNTTIEANKVLDLSSGVLITVNKAESLFNSLQEAGKKTVNTLQFWKENEGNSDGSDIKETLEKDLDASKEKIQKMPNEIEKRSRGSITSISIVQKELQTIKIAEMLSSK
ncbi:hypothetical protein D0469_06625 [Peribacillus saganii]|uniref:Uncharacterized protein n=1 Tax=Peribacillus saganii TaxID=2303992 RepID=A0A372LSS2_9BACI|nr:hypothetical protein D0469_06625 [Peribacillus saganii]